MAYRTCIICRASHPKRELLRIVYVSNAGLRLDTSGKLAGRGAYICRQRACWKSALVTDTLGKSLRINLHAGDRAAFKNQLETLYSTEFAENAGGVGGGS